MKTAIASILTISTIVTGVHLTLSDNQQDDNRQGKNLANEGRSQPQTLQFAHNRWFNASGSIFLNIDSDNDDADTRALQIVKNTDTDVGGEVLVHVSENGNVGIGTTAPSYPLHVESDIAVAPVIEGHATGAGASGVRGVAERGGYGVWGINNFDSGTGVIGQATGDEAIGVRGSGGKYGVYGTTFAASGEGVFGGSWGNAGSGVFGRAYETNGRGVYGYASYSSGPTYGVVGQVDSSSGYAAYFIGPAGSQNFFSRDVGINTLSPAFLLHVNGSAGKPGGGSWSNSSDRRLKRNIDDLDGALDSLLKLRGVTFEYEDPEAINELPGTRIGVIAQEVEEVFPEWVDERNDGYKAVTFRGFEALTIEAMRELKAENDDLRSRNDALRARLETLELRLVALTASDLKESETSRRHTD